MILPLSRLRPLSGSSDLWFRCGWKPSNIKGFGTRHFLNNHFCNRWNSNTWLVTKPKNRIIETQQQSCWVCTCGQSPMILATPQGVGTVWHSQRAYTHRKAANGQSFYFNWGAHDLSLVFTCLLIQAFPKNIFYNSVSRILFICRFCFFYWTLKLFLNSMALPGVFERQS